MSPGYLVESVVAVTPVTATAALCDAEPPEPVQVRV
jgi:hypothetical protein